MVHSLKSFKVLISAKMAEAYESFRPHRWNPSEIDTRWNHARLPNWHATSKGTGVPAGGRWSEIVAPQPQGYWIKWPCSFTPVWKNTIIFHVWKRMGKYQKRLWNNNSEDGRNVVENYLKQKKKKSLENQFQMIMEM